MRRNNTIELSSTNVAKPKQKKNNNYINKNFLIWVNFPFKTKPVLFIAETYRLLINDDKLVNKHFLTVKYNKFPITTILSIKSLKVDFVKKSDNNSHHSPLEDINPL